MAAILTDARAPLPPVAVYGAGGHGREIAWLARACAAAGRSGPFAGFVDDAADHEGGALESFPVSTLAGLARRAPDARLVVAVGSPEAREAMAAKVRAAGFGFATLVHPSVAIPPDLRLGAGCVVQAGCVVTVGVTLGDHVHLNIGCLVSHDVTIDAFANVTPGVRLSGNVHVGHHAYVGSGATVIHGRPGAPLRIGARAIVGAGAVVVRDVEPGSTVVGVPARLIGLRRT